MNQKICLTMATLVIVAASSVSASAMPPPALRIPLFTRPTALAGAPASEPSRCVPFAMVPPPVRPRILARAVAIGPAKLAGVDLDTGAKIEVRLSFVRVAKGSTCRSYGMPIDCGELARRVLDAIIGELPVQCDVDAGTCDVLGPEGWKSVNRMLVRAGMATAASTLYSDAEAAARRDRIGLFDPENGVGTEDVPSAVEEP